MYLQPLMSSCAMHIDVVIDFQVFPSFLKEI
jgi:hypothetical protein